MFGGQGGGGFGGGGFGAGAGGFGAGGGANPNATPWSPNTPFGGGGAPAPAQTPFGGGGASFGGAATPFGGGGSSFGGSGGGAATFGSPAASTPFGGGGAFGGGAAPAASSTFGGGSGGASSSFGGGASGGFGGGGGAFGGGSGTFGGAAAASTASSTPFGGGGSSTFGGGGSSTFGGGSGASGGAPFGGGSSSTFGGGGGSGTFGGGASTTSSTPFGGGASSTFGGGGAFGGGDAGAAKKGAPSTFGGDKESKKGGGKAAAAKTPFKAGGAAERGRSRERGGRGAGAGARDGSGGRGGGDRGGSSSSASVKVSGLPLDVGEDALRATFGAFGAVKSTRVARQASTGHSRGTGFVNFESGDAAREAAAALDGTDAFHKGKAIHCALQAARPAPDAGGKGAPGGKGGKGAASAGKGAPAAAGGLFCVKVAGLGSELTDEAFSAAVAPLEGLRSVRVLRDPRGAALYGYANFGSRKEADAACRELKRSAAFGGTPICTVKESREKPSDAGRSLSPPKAAPRPAAPKKAAAGPPRAVLVAKGAPKDERSLKSVFESFGAVESCHVSEAATYVLFEDADAAALAAREMSGIDAFMAGALECAVGAPPGNAAPAKAPQFAGAKVWTREAAAPPKEAPKPKPAERADLKARNAERFAAHDVAKTPARPRSPRSRSPAKIVQQEAGAADDLVGGCLQFCPQDEIDERVRFRELDKYEKPPGHEAMDDDELARRAVPLAMKKYKRSAAGDVQSKPEIVRPPDVLFAAFEHLAAHVIDDAAPGDSEDDQMTRYIFLWNRFRAIRKDFILQNFTTGGNVDARVVRVFEGMARYFIGIEQQLSGHPEWREGIAHGKHNAESLSETLSALLAFYEMGKHAADADDVLRNEPEFTQYWLIYFLDQEQGAEAGRLLTVLALKRPLLRESDAVRRAAEIKRCREERNYARFFGLVREAPYLVRCLAVAQYADGMRLDALEVMGKAYVKSEPYPAGELADLLCLSGPEEARRRAVDYGYSVDAQGDVLFAATGADVDLDAFGDGGGSKRAPLFGAQDLGAAVRTPRGEADPEAAAKERALLAAREAARREAAETAARDAEAARRKAAADAEEARLRRELVAKQEAAAAEAARQREAARLAAEQAAAEKAAAEKAAAEEAARVRSLELEAARRREEAEARRLAAEKAAAEEAARREAARLALIEERRRRTAEAEARAEARAAEARDARNAAAAARHHAVATFRRLVRRCAAKKRGRAADAKKRAAVYLRLWRYRAAARHAARLRYLRVLQSFSRWRDTALAPSPFPDYAARAPPTAAARSTSPAPRFAAFRDLGAAAERATSDLADTLARLCRPRVDARRAVAAAAPAGPSAWALGLVGAAGDGLLDAVAAALDDGGPRKRARDCEVTVLRFDSVAAAPLPAVDGLLVVASKDRAEDAAAVLDAHFIGREAMAPCAVLHDGADGPPAPLLDELRGRVGACSHAATAKRSMALGGDVARCLAFLAARKPPRSLAPPATRAVAARVVATPPKRPDVAAIKRARAALALANARPAPAPAEGPAKRSRIDRAVVAEAQASDDFSSWLAGVVGGDA